MPSETACPRRLWENPSCYQFSFHWKQLDGDQLNLQLQINFNKTDKAALIELLHQNFFAVSRSNQIWGSISRCSVAQIRSYLEFLQSFCWNVKIWETLMVLNELLVLKIWFWKYGFNLLWISQAGNRKFSTQRKWAKDERKNSLQTKVAQNCPKCSILFKDLHILDLIGKLFSIRMVIENKRLLKGHASQDFASSQLRRVATQCLTFVI